MHLVDWQSVWLMDEQTSDRKHSLTSVPVEYLAGTTVADSLVKVARNNSQFIQLLKHENVETIERKIDCRIPGDPFFCSSPLNCPDH